MTTADDSFQRLSLVADLADMLDPTLDDDAQHAAMERVMKAEPEVGMALLTGFTRGLIEGLSEQHPDGAAGVMRKVRDHFSRTPLDD